MQSAPRRLSPHPSNRACLRHILLAQADPSHTRGKHARLVQARDHLRSPPASFCSSSAHVVALHDGTTGLTADDLYQERPTNVVIVYAPGCRSPHEVSR